MQVPVPRSDYGPYCNQFSADEATCIATQDFDQFCVYTAGTPVTSSVAEINYNDNLGNLSELSSCSDRGLDNGDGECECFDGFRGLACEEQEALV